MKDFLLPNTGIYYRTNEFQNGRQTLFFVHGLSSSSSAWIEYEKKFKDTYNLVLIDLRGHGKSPRFSRYEDYKISLFVNDIYTLVKYLEIKDFFLVSYSFGTLIAFEFLALHQDLLKGAVFLSPSINVGKELMAKVIQPFLYIAYILPIGKKAGEHVEYSTYLGTGDWNLRRLSRDVWNTGIAVYLFCTKQSYTWQRDELPEKVNIPTLLIHGKKDTIFPVKNSIELHKRISRSELIIIDNADHIVVLNNFAEVSSAIEKFIEKNAN